MLPAAGLAKQDGDNDTRRRVYDAGAVEALVSAAPERVLGPAAVSLFGRHHALEDVTLVEPEFTCSLLSVR